MRNDSPQNFDCEFSPEVVDFIYGELSGERRQAFELHAGKCAVCAAEIADFTGVRTAVKNWKTAEFDRLPTPSIEIPYSLPASRTDGFERSVFGLASVRSWFSLSPVFSGAAGALLLALAVGLGMYFFGGQDDDLVAGSNTEPAMNVKPPVEPQPSAGIVNKETEVDPPESGIDENIQGNEPRGEKQTRLQPAPVRAGIKTVSKQKNRPVKTAEKEPPASRPDKSVQAGTPTDGNRPRLNELPEEDEDNSLRLADLFAEIDTRE